MKTKEKELVLTWDFLEERFKEIKYGLFDGDEPLTTEKALEGLYEEYNLPLELRELFESKEYVKDHSWVADDVIMSIVGWCQTDFSDVVSHRDDIYTLLDRNSNKEGVIALTVEEVYAVIDQAATFDVEVREYVNSWHGDNNE